MKIALLAHEPKTFLACFYILHPSRLYAKNGRSLCEVTHWYSGKLGMFLFFFLSLSEGSGGVVSWGLLAAPPMVVIRPS